MKGLTLRKSPLHKAAFTLIELMVVVGIISVLCTIGIPAVFKAVQKRDPLTQSVFDLWMPALRPVLRPSSAALPWS